MFAVPCKCEDHACILSGESYGEGNPIVLIHEDSECQMDEDFTKRDSRDEYSVYRTKDGRILCYLRFLEGLASFQYDILTESVVPHKQEQSPYEV